VQITIAKRIRARSNVEELTCGSFLFSLSVSVNDAVRECDTEPFIRLCTHIDTEVKVNIYSH
jgi:hypothetical protein